MEFIPQSLKYGVLVLTKGPPPFIRLGQSVLGSRAAPAWQLYLPLSVLKCYGHVDRRELVSWSPSLEDSKTQDEIGMGDHRCLCKVQK